MKSKITKEAACDGKIKYDSKSDASLAAASLSNRGRIKKKVNAYLCEFCEKYHIGNSRHKKKRKEGYRDKRDTPFNGYELKPAPGIDKGFYLVKSNLQK